MPERWNPHENAARTAAGQLRGEALRRCSARVLTNLAGLALLLTCSCGRSPSGEGPSPDAPAVAGSETVTLYVQDMGERLELL